MSLSEIPQAARPSSTTSPSEEHSIGVLPNLVLDPSKSLSPIRSLPSSHTHSHSLPHSHEPAPSLPQAKTTKQHPSAPSGTANASIFFVGTATTILEWEGVRLMTDPNFLHAGDHVHLGPG